MIFVDTSAWFALLDRSCLEHERAKAFVAKAHAPFVTSDYILAEVLTLLRARRLNRQATELGQNLLAERQAKRVWVTPKDVRSAWMLFGYRDKQWSFVDCVSFAIMQRLGIRDAFAFDEHFRQIGTLVVDPD